MPLLNIAKFAAFVIFVCLYVCALGSCSATVAKKSGANDSPFADAVTVGNLEDAEITESSGIAASKCQPDVYWTHNDSGDEAFIFAFGPKGQKLGTWRVPGATNYDWEDIASSQDPSGKCYLYIGDIGDNGTKRDDYTVYKIIEPIIGPADANSSRREPLETARPEIVRYTYPNGKHNAETLMVDQRSGALYVVTKRYSGPARVFKLKKGDVIAENLGELALPAVPNGSVTGGDISGNGERVVLCDYSAVYEYTILAGKTIDTFIQGKPITVVVGNRAIGESVGYSRDGNILTLTSEGVSAPIIQLKRK